ncbi:MAG: hypothetical protein ACYSWQ_25330 [Planctomycetota bacterium]|jgi:hypothetical protein
MRRKLPSQRRLAVYLAIFFLGVAGVCFVSLMVDGVYFWHQQRFTCLAALSVDLSTPGTYTASMQHWPRILNWVVLGLDVPRKVLAETPPGELIAGLEGTYSVRDEDGVRIFWGAIVEDPNEVSTCSYPNIVRLSRLDSWYGEVKWQVDVIVTHGAPGLKGVRQRLVLIDKMDRLSDWRTVGACFALFIAATILIFVLDNWRREKKRQQKGNKPVDGD